MKSGYVLHCLECRCKVRSSLLAGTMVISVYPLGEVGRNLWLSDDRTYPDTTSEINLQHHFLVTSRNAKHCQYSLGCLEGEDTYMEKPRRTCSFCIFGAPGGGIARAPGLNREELLKRAIVETGWRKY